MDLNVKKSSRPCRLARSMYRFVKNDLLFGLALVPYGRARQRALRRRAERSDSHTYTSFYRSPLQLEALTGPVLSQLEARGVREPSILVFGGSNGAEAYTLASELLFRFPERTITIRASDLHAETVDHARRATYSLEEISKNLKVPEEFMARTFDRAADQYVVKPAVRARVSFEQADLLDPLLPTRYQPADIVFAQNVLFHLPPPLARQAFAAIARFLKPGSVLFLEGMELDMRVDLTQRAGLIPLDYKVREIYEHSRAHIPLRWWNYYFGNEPWFPFADQPRARYATIFTVPAGGVAR